ncbi:hypothetical protein BC962_0408 [Gillisia mitskevichiae]|uniref:Lipoprotein n=1 Tax=Gillisia mitskevichiae TaxID=270921 RepID=A0A495PWA6_9FLAO|nr:hypothetical protein [Gillisia mitskevichiae]RKS55445.1 hypothetical protein BC962_0408 [Gillisia mitskevichiae]
MKRLLAIIFIAFIILSCSKDDTESLQQELVPTVSVNIPDSLKTGQAYEFEVLYKKTSNCHYFSGFDVSKNEHTIIVGVVNNYSSVNNNCSTNGNLQEAAKLNFVVEREDFYIFKFWQGKSSVGEDVFLTKEVPIIPSDI